MRLLRRFIWLVLVALITGCTAMQAPIRNAIAEYPFRHEAFDFITSWKTTKSGENVAVDGVVKNLRLFQVSDIQLWVKVLNKSKKIKTEESTLLLPVYLGTDESLPFNVTLKNVGFDQGDMLNFVILYRVDDDSKSSFTWLSSFTVDAVTGVETGDGEIKGKH